MLPCSRFLGNICRWEGGTEGDALINDSNIDVATSQSGSMTKVLFPCWCEHFVKFLPKGSGKDGKPVILVFDGHTSRWTYEGLQLLLDNNVFCLCIPGHTSIWAQPNDCGPNSSLKSIIGSKLSDYRLYHHQVPGVERAMKFTQNDFNGCFVQAWKAWQEKMDGMMERLGKNAITSGWRGTGLHPFDRYAPRWQGAIARFGQRQAAPAREGCEASSGGADDPALSREERLERMLRAASAAEPGTAATPATTAGAASAAAATALRAPPLSAAPAVTTPPPRGASTAPPTADGPQPLLASPQAMAVPIISPINIDAPAATTPEALREEREAQLRGQAEHADHLTREAEVAERERCSAFASKLESLQPSDTLQLLPVGELQEGATVKGSKVIRTDVGYILIEGTTGKSAELSLDEGPRSLAPRFALFAGTEPLSQEAKHSINKKKSRMAAAEEKAERARVIKEAESKHLKDHQSLFKKLQGKVGGQFSVEDYLEVYNLSSSPPPMIADNHLVYASPAVSKGTVVSKAVIEAIADPIRQCLMHAQMREAAVAAMPKRHREVSITQTTFGMNVTEKIRAILFVTEAKKLQEKQREQRKADTTAARINRETNLVGTACAKLVKGTDADRLTIPELKSLIKWRGGTAPENTSRHNKPALVLVWTKLQVSDEEIRLAAAAVQSAAPTQEEEGTAEGDEGESEDDENGSDDEGREEESEDEEEGPDAKALIGKKMLPGGSVVYLVDWEPECDEEGDAIESHEPTWVDSEDICEELISEYEAQHAGARTRSRTR